VSRRRVSVEFVAELGRFRRGTQAGAADVRKLKAESTAARAEVARLGRDSVRAGDDLKRFARGGRASLLDLRTATRSARDDMAGLANRTSRAAGSFAEVNGSARAALTTLRMLPPVLSSVGARIRALRLAEAARDAGRFGRGLAGAAGDLGGAAPASSALGLAAIPAAAGAATAALQTIPPVLTVIGGGLGAVPGLAAGAVASVGTLKLAFGGLGDALDDVFAGSEDPYDDLSRSGQRLVDVLASQRNALLDVRRVAQDRVFADLDAEVVALGQVALPFAIRQAERFGDTWNTTFRQLARLGRNREFLTGLDDALDVTDAFFDKVNARIPATGLALGRLFTNSMPFISAFGDSLLEYTDDFNAWIDRTARTGQLRAFFADAGRQADALLDLTRELLVTIGKIGGLRQGSTLLRDMADAVARFNAEARNMSTVEGVIASGNAAIQGVVDVLLVLGETLGETLADPGTRDAIALFFNVLKVGAEIVGDLASLFTGLYDPIQSAILAGAALAILWGKLQGAGAAMGLAVGAANDRLRQTGPLGQRAATGLQSMATAAGRAVPVLLALQVAAAVFASFRDAPADIDRLSKSIHNFAVTGERGGEMMRILGRDADEVSRTLWAAGDSWWAAEMRAAEAIPVIGELQRGFSELFHGQSFTGAAENVKALDQAMAQLVETSGKQAGIKAWDQLLRDSGMDATELIALLPAFEQALKDADDAASATAKRQQLLNGSMEEAITLTGSYTRAWAQLNGQMLSSDQAMLTAKEALDAVKESFKENGRAIEGNSEAALRNRVAIGEASQKWAEAAQAKYEETGSIEEANKVYEQYIAQLRKTLDQAELTDAQIQYLIDTYAAMPAYKSTPISAPGVEGATDKANGFYMALRRLPNGKFVRVRVDGVETAIQRVNRLQREINALTGKNIRIGVSGGRGGNLERWGGVHEYARAGLINLRQAALFSTANPARYGFAEPATGGEAFIPRRGDRERSISIGRRAMEWYGMDVVPKAGSLQYGPAMSMPVAAPAPTGGQTPSPAALAQAIRAALAGVGVYLDGRAVGRIQGRDADIMARVG
jgi:hypothetical protein